MALQPGSRLGPYEVVGRLGAGGMGEVYRARDERLRRDVAIKVLPASFADDPERLARFETEARAAGQLNDPHVLSVYDIGTHDGAPYLVTELLEGQSLRDRLADGPLPPRKAIDVALQITRGLAAAHARNIVHRDLKPDNIFVTPEGRAKILDFGLARVTTDPSPSSTMATTLQATNPGTILGTAGYMAPEQVRALPTDARSDLFSFGAILYEMLTGVHAFVRENTADTLAAILKEDPPEPSASSVVIPPALDRLIRRCLEKEPAERFQSARDLSFALEALAGGPGTTSSVSIAADADAVAARPSRRSPAVFGPIVGVGLLSLVAGLVAAQLIWPVADGPAAPARLQQITFTGASVQLPSLAPDGTAVAFSQADDDGNDDIFLQRIGGENPVNLTAGSTADDFQPAFSPDGRSIAFRSQRDGGGIFIMGATGESVRRLTDEGFNPAWSPDGLRIVYATEGIFGPASRSQVSRLVQIEVATGAKTTLLDGDGVQPSWSPDGRWIAFWGLPAGTGRRVIYTMPAAGGAPTAIIDDTALNWSPVWSHNGRYVYFASDREPPMNIWRLAVDASTGAAAGEPERVTISSEEHFGLSASAAGTFVVPAVTELYELRRYPLDVATGSIGVTSSSVWRTTRAITTAVPSPDGQYLAFFVSDPREDLVVMRVDGTDITRLTNDAFRDRGPFWAADSSRIYFYSDRSGHYEAWTIRRDGSGLEQLTSMPGSDSRMGGFMPSPSGTLLAQLGVSPSPHLAFVDLSVPLAERRPDAVPLPAGALFFNPIAWRSDDEVAGFSNGAAPGTGRIHVYSRQSGTYRQLTGDLAALGFGLVGRDYFGVANDGRVVIIDGASGGVRYGDPIADKLSPRAQNASPSAGGDALFVTERDSVTNLWLLTVGPERQ